MTPATDRILAAIAETVEQYRADLDADPFLEAVRIEVRIAGTEHRGYRPGEVRAVVVQHQSEVRPRSRQVRVAEA